MGFCEGYLNVKSPIRELFLTSGIKYPLRWRIGKTVRKISPKWLQYITIYCLLFYIEVKEK